MNKLETKAWLRAEFAREDQAIFELTGKTGTNVASEWPSKFAPRLSLIAIKNILFHSRQGMVNNRGLSFTDALTVAGLTVGESSHGARSSSTRAEWCARAEPYFVDLLGQVLNNDPAEQTRVSVYHSTEGEALAIRKRVAASSAITLAPLVYNDVVLPAGTLVGVGNTSNQNQTGQRSKGPVTYRTFEVDELDVNPMRLSPWAFPNMADRAMFGCDTFLNKIVWCDPVRANSLAATSLADFQQAAEVVMNMCGVLPKSMVV